MEREFDTHFEFTIWVHIHGRNEEGACENVEEIFNDEFIGGISNLIHAGVGYETEVVSELKNGLFEVAMKWSGYYTIDAKNKKGAKETANTILNSRLTYVYQAIENFAAKQDHLKFNDHMIDEVTEVVELPLKSA